MTQSIKFETECSILEFSRITIGSGTLPHRLVLRELPDKFVIHTEIMRIENERENLDGSVDEVVTFKHDSFENGTYFDFNEGDVHDRFEALGNARARFYERSRAQW